MSTPSSPPRPARPSWRRRLTRHALRFLLVAAVLLGPNLVFFGRWFVPDTPIPAVPAAVDPMDTAGLPPALASDFAAAVAAGRSRAGLPSVSAATHGVATSAGPASAGSPTSNAASPRRPRRVTVRAASPSRSRRWR